MHVYGAKHSDHQINLQEVVSSLGVRLVLVELLSHHARQFSLLYSVSITVYATSIAKTWSYVSEVGYEGGPVKCVVNSCIVPFIIDDCFLPLMDICMLKPYRY